MTSGAQFRSVLRWSGLIDEVCSMTGEDRWRFAALGLRESRWGDALTPSGDPCGTGDGGHGRGLVQLDDRYHRAFVESPAFLAPKQQLFYACGVLNDARAWFRVRMPALTDPDLLERAVYAAYNCGPGNVRKALTLGRVVDGELSHDVDAYTTGNDYSHWIWRRAAEMKAALPSLFDPPKPTEQRYPPGPPPGKGTP